MKIDVNNITFFEHSATDELQVRVGIRSGLVKTAIRHEIEPAKDE